MPELDFIRNQEQTAPVPEVANDPDCRYVHEDHTEAWLRAKGDLLNMGRGHLLRYRLPLSEGNLVDSSTLVR
eukprot:4249621-Lingulodinium_polyedra.AAC.1